MITKDRLQGAGWRRLLPDVYIQAETIIDHLTWCSAVLLAAPTGAVIGYSSALGLYCPEVRPGPDDPVDLIVPRTATRRSHPRRRVHRMHLEPGDVWTFAGFPVTTPERTGFDLARGKDLIEAVVQVDALLERGVVSKREIEDFRPRRLPGSARAARALELAVRGAQSPMETRTRLALVLGGLPTPQTQYEVFDELGFVARLDLAYPERKIGIEYDGDHHRERETFRRDAARANRLRLIGWTVLRFTADDVVHHADRMVHQVRVLLGE